MKLREVLKVRDLSDYKMLKQSDLSDPILDVDSIKGSQLMVTFGDADRIQLIELNKDINDQQTINLLGAYKTIIPNVKLSSVIMGNDLANALSRLAEKGQISLGQVTGSKIDIMILNPEDQNGGNE